MCGIIGCICSQASDRSGRSIARRLRQGCEALTHRGPDDGRVWFPIAESQARVGLGHRRLNVFGGVSSTQPMHDPNASVAISVNGELYDPEDQLRLRLQSLGHAFRTEGDSELALRAYIQFGLDFVDFLRGEFAILLYDERERQMVAVRDRFGIKPLLFAQHEDEWWFASQSVALAKAGIALQMDEESVWHATSFQYTLPDRTLFEGIYQVEPGQMVVVRTDRAARFLRYWDLDYPINSASKNSKNGQGLADGNDNEATVNEFRTRLDESVRLRMRGTEPIAAHLSGGVDSCSVLASALTDSSIDRAFTVTFPGADPHDEERLAASVARELNVDWSSVTGDQQRLLDNLPTAVERSEGWCVNGHLPAKYLLNQSIRDAGFKVVITGEGADELLYGYPHLMADHCFQGLVAPGLRREHLASTGIMLPTSEGLGLQEVKRSLGFLPTFLRAKASLGAMLQSHLKEEFLKNGPFRHRDPYEELIATFHSRGQLQGRAPVHQSAYLWAKTALPQYILRTLGDGCESAHGVEGRLPMLDHQLFEWVKRLPLNMFFRERPATDICASTWHAKWILRRANQSRLPSDVVWRPKHPFVAPPLVSSSFERLGDIRDRIVTAAEEHPYFDTERILETLERTCDAGLSQRVQVDPLWWVLLSSHAMFTQRHEFSSTVTT